MGILKLKIKDKSDYLLFNPYTLKFGNDLTPPKAEFNQKHTREPEIIKILFGNACNYRCKYCRQFIHNKKQIITKEKLDNLVSKLKDNLKFHNLRYIGFWGGEPLLYWDEMVYLIEKLSPFFPSTYLNKITTNGSLLTKEKIDYLINTPFFVKLSHDGPGQVLRGGDPLETNYDNIKFLYDKLTNKSFFVNSVLTKLCLSPYEILKYLQNKLGSDILLRKIETVIPYNINSKKYAIEEENYSLFSNTIMHDLINTNVINHILEYKKLFNVFIDRQDPNFLDIYNMCSAKCHQRQNDSIAVDLDGNVTPCQVFDASSIAYLGKLNEIEKFNERPPTLVCDLWENNCKDCPVIYFCRGNCPYFTDMDTIKVGCKMKFHTFWGVLRAFIYMFYGLEIEGYEKNNI